MRKVFIVCLFIFSAQNLLSQDKLFKKASQSVNIIQSDLSLSEDKIKKGLEEALKKGSKYAVSQASKHDGFNASKLIRIHFPSQAINIKRGLVKIGFQNQIEFFEESMNRAAELASKQALPILISAIKEMNINDVYSIYKGNVNAATIFLKQQTSQKIYKELKPIVIISMQEIKVTQKWNMLSKKYNSLPFTKPVNTDLEDYITNKTIYGLFVLVEQQEKEIRNNPVARTSDILKQVFD
tara:strand:- start:691 stop:1407 length:717 start_codon:yes stop_codon:yes gene_type:complete